MKDKGKIDFQCEIKDTMQALQRFLVVNNKNVVFVGALMAFEGKNQEKMKKNTGAIFAHGNKFHLRNLINDLRSTIEDEADKDDFVNL